MTSTTLLAATVYLATLSVACVEEPENLQSAEQALSQGDVSTMNRIGSQVGMKYAWTDPRTRDQPGTLDVAVTPVSGVVRTSSAVGLAGGFEHQLRIGAGDIDPCWFLNVTSGGTPVMSVTGLPGAKTYGDAAFQVVGKNFTIEGSATPLDPERPDRQLQFVVRDSAGNIVFDSSK